MEKLILTMEQSRISNSGEALAFSLINREFHDLIHKVSDCEHYAWASKQG
jgi:hypothetical protein